MFFLLQNIFLRMCCFSQAYEALHGLLEVAEAQKHSALQRVCLLEEERIRVYDYVINEGVQLPSSLCADDA